MSFPFVSTKEKSNVIVSFSPTNSSGFLINVVFLGSGTISSSIIASSPISNGTGSRDKDL